MNDRSGRHPSTDSPTFPGLARSDDRSLLTGAVLVAVALHALALLVELPETRGPARVPRPEPPHLVRPSLPPPPIERHPVPGRDTTRRLPVPDPTPDAPEPITEPRSARVGADLVLQAIVHRDGSVGDVTVLRCNRPHLGFESAAIEAVRRWRYQPATQNGRPVDVVFTVLIRFELR